MHGPMYIKFKVTYFILVIRQTYATFNKAPRLSSRYASFMTTDGVFAVQFNDG